MVASSKILGLRDDRWPPAQAPLMTRTEHDEVRHNPWNIRLVSMSATSSQIAAAVNQTASWQRTEVPGGES